MAMATQRKSAGARLSLHQTAKQRLERPLTPAAQPKQDHDDLDRVDCQRDKQQRWDELRSQLEDELEVAVEEHETISESTSVSVLLFVTNSIKPRPLRQVTSYE